MLGLDPDWLVLGYPLIAETEVANFYHHSPTFLLE